MRQISTKSMIATPLILLVPFAIALVPSAAPSRQEAACRSVSGHYAEHAVAPNACPSPVGLCIAGEFSGSLRGAFDSTATAFVATADSPTTSVTQFTGDGTIHLRAGDLFFKSSGAYHTSGRGEIVDLQFITGGNRGLDGATGELRASGTFDPASSSGESEYTGTVCLARADAR